MPTESTDADKRVLTLTEALGLAPIGPQYTRSGQPEAGHVVAFTGSGGKTTAMLRLAGELVSSGGRVLVTTTTHILSPDPQQFPVTIVENSLAVLIRLAEYALERHQAVVLARGMGKDDKLLGLDPDWIADLRDRLPLTYLLVEADGSRRRPFKAPATYEPVIPLAADWVITVAGLSAIGEPLSEDFVHRPERVAALCGVPLDNPITPAMMAAVLRHPEGSTRGAPARAKVVALLNQADDVVRLRAGREVARELIARGAERVVVAALQETTPIREVIVEGGRGTATVDGFAVDGKGERRLFSVAAIVLAAGVGRRMNTPASQMQGSTPAGQHRVLGTPACLSPRSPKLALRLGGKSLLRRVVEAALASTVNEIVVVLGCGADELALELPHDPRIRKVFNPEYTAGQSTSLKAGIDVIGSGAEAAVFLLGDQPLISSEAITALIEVFRSSRAAIVRPLYRGTPGNPVLFARSLFGELQQVTGDQGGRELLARHKEHIVTVDLDLELPLDVDTADDYSRLLRKFSDPEKL